MRLVEVYATVTDRRGMFVADLPQETFSIFEDGRRQVVKVFSAGRSPVAIAILLDRSFSMSGDRLAAARRSARLLLATLGPRDQSIVLAVGSEVREVSPLRTDHAAAAASLDALDAWGTTPLHDAVLVGLDRLSGASGRRALVLLTDGEDRYSRAASDEVMARTREAGVLMYPVVLGKRPARLLVDLAATSGGRTFEARDASGIEPAFARVADELRCQYLLGYEPDDTRPGEAGAWRSIRIVVQREGLAVRARAGYIVP